MHSSPLSFVSNAAHTASVAARADPPPENPDAVYRGLGMALAASVSAGFWVVVLAAALPVAGIVPSAAALGWIAGVIATIVCATMLALKDAD